MKFLIYSFWHTVYMLVFLTRIFLIYAYWIFPFEFSFLEEVILLVVAFMASPETLIWFWIMDSRIKYNHNWWWAPFYKKNSITLELTPATREHLQNIKYHYKVEDYLFYDLLPPKLFSGDHYQVFFLKKSDFIEFKLKFI